MKLFFILLLALLFLWYGWRIVRFKKEQDLLKSDMYADTVDRWEHIQAWYVRQRPVGLLPYQVILDTYGFSDHRISVKEDGDGKIYLPENLSPSEFILAIGELEDYLSTVSSYRKTF